MSLITVVGMKYRNDYSEFRNSEFFQIKLEYEPENKVDPNAIRVLAKCANDKIHHIGYIRRVDQPNYSATPWLKIKSTIKQNSAWFYRLDVNTVPNL